MGYLEPWPAKGKRQFWSCKHPVSSSEMMSLQEEVVYKQYFGVEYINGMSF